MRRWIRLGVVLAAIVGATLVVRAVVPPRLPDDQLVRDAVEMIRTELQELPKDHPIIHRYGHFVSTPSAMPEFVNHPGGREYGGDPPSIGFDLTCHFEKYAAQIPVGIYHGKDREVYELVMTPDFHPFGIIGKETTEFDGEDVWVSVTDRPEGERDIRMKSEFYCIISHPGFRPKGQPNNSIPFFDWWR